MPIFRDLWTKLKAIVAPKASAKGWRGGRVTTHESHDAPVIVNQETGRELRKREWCRNFNVRQRWIVPDVSPESIYYKTQKPKRRRK